jgi:hypothetical protein
LHVLVVLAPLSVNTPCTITSVAETCLVHLMRYIVASTNMICKWCVRSINYLFAEVNLRLQKNMSARVPVCDALLRAYRGGWEPVCHTMEPRVPIRRNHAWLRVLNISEKHPAVLACM